MRGSGCGVVGQGGYCDEIISVAGFDVRAGEGIERFGCLFCNEVINSAGVEILVLTV